MTYLGNHTKQVQRGLNIGFALFIISEVMAFISVFWAFFHASLSPDVALGSSWPPLGIDALDPFSIPLLNTLLLLSSGVSQKCELSEFFIIMCNSLPFSKPRIPSEKRIGPHNYNILSILIGSLLGDGHMERDGNGSRFSFYQAKVNGEYLLWLHKSISELGYAKIEIPQMFCYAHKKGLLENEIRYYFRFRSFTYTSFNWIYESFYPNGTRKIIPKIIDTYLSPMALAI